MAAVLNAVAESGVDQFYLKLFHLQQDMVIHRRNTIGDGNVEGNSAAVILRHISRNGISANLGLGLKQPEIKSVRVVMQRPCSPQPGNASANYGDAPQFSALPVGCHDFQIVSLSLDAGLIAGYSTIRHQRGQMLEIINSSAVPFLSPSAAAACMNASISVTNYDDIS